MYLRKEPGIVRSLLSKETVWATSGETGDVVRSYSTASLLIKLAALRDARRSVSRQTEHGQKRAQPWMRP